MQALREDQGIDVYLRAFRFLAIRLRSRPETVELKPGADTQRENLRAANDRFEDALEERVAATAEIEYLDVKLDEQVLALARQLNVLIAGNREDPRYKKLFPVAPTTMMKPVAGDDQSTMVQAIVDRISNDADFSSLQHFAEPVRARLDQLEAATKARKQLYVAEALAQADRRSVMDDARRVYRLMQPRLTLMFPDDSALVESFFATLSGGTRAEAAAPVQPVDAPA